MWATPGQRGFPARTGSGPAPVPGAPAAPRAPAVRPQSVPTLSQRAAALPKMSAAQQAAYLEQQRRLEEAQRLQLEAFEKARELKDVLDGLEKVNDEGRRASLLDTLCSVDDVLKLPEHPGPPGRASGELKVDLLKHQVRGVIVPAVMRE